MYEKERKINQKQLDIINDINKHRFETQIENLRRMEEEEELERQKHPRKNKKPKKTEEDDMPIEEYWRRAWEFHWWDV